MVLVTRRASPVTGLVKHLFLNFPSGLFDPATGLNLVEVRLIVGVKTYPAEDFFALNDRLLAIPLQCPVVKGDTISLEVRNRDAVNPHTIQAYVLIEEITKEESSEKLSEKSSEQPSEKSSEKESGEAG